MKRRVVESGDVLNHHLLLLEPGDKVAEPSLSEEDALLPVARGEQGQTQGQQGHDVSRQSHLMIMATALT